MKEYLIKAAEHMSDKGYELSTHEKQQEFAKQRLFGHAFSRGQGDIRTDEEPDYDVVIDTLQQKRDTLWKTTQENINADMFNVMDTIRFEQISQLGKAIDLWKSALNAKSQQTT